MNDFNHYLRAIVVVESRIQALHNPIYYKFTTSPVFNVIVILSVIESLLSFALLEFGFIEIPKSLIDF